MKLKSTVAYAWQKIEQPMHTLTIKALAICLGMSVVFGSGVAPVKELMVQEVYAATQEITDFTDYSSIRDYAKEPISALLANGGIQGYPDGSFKPSNSISRIEFTSMAFNAVDPSGGARAKIIDAMKNEVEIDKTLYEISRESKADDIADVWGGKAQDLIIISGNIGAAVFDASTQEVNGRSGWLAPVTRAEAAQILAVALDKLGGEQLPIKDNVESIITDWQTNHSPESTNLHYNTVKGCNESKFIKQLYSAGIVTGNENGDFQPQYNMTREAASNIIYRAVNKDKRAAVNIAPKQEAPKPDNAIFDIKDASRRDLVEGDKLTVDGKTYEIKAGVGGILGEGLPIGIDTGRTLTDDNVKLEPGVISDGTVGRLGDRYMECPSTGEAHFRDDWEKIMDGYVTIQESKGPGIEGQHIKVGLDGSLELEYIGGGWLAVPPSWLYF